MQKRHSCNICTCIKKWMPLIMRFLVRSSWYPAKWIFAITVLGDGCRQRDICALALSRKQTINSALKKMEKQGLLRLESGKGREKHIYLTASGRRNADESVKPIYDAEQAAFAEMAEAEREQLVALTGKFIHLLQKQTAHLAPEFREKGEK